MALKGKEVAAPATKRKKESAGRFSGRKRRNSGVLQFFDVAADVRGEEEDESEEEEFDKDFLDEVRAELNDKNGGLVKAYDLPIVPKEEELSGDELERYLEERYKTGSHHVKYAGEEFGPVGERDSDMPSKNDPTIWRIKCMVGRERQIVFSLMHKYVNLHSLGSKLKIVSAFALEHTKGFFYIEAERQSDVLEACKGLTNIYFSRISPLPNDEVSRLISVQNTKPEVPKPTWARLKHGKYKGDLAQVVSVEEKRVTVKLLPRINVQALAKKLAGGGTLQEAKVPAPRIITSSDLEDIRLHIKSKRDRQTGEVFETVDGLTLKDGYLYKKVSLVSLKYLTALPSAEELEKFTPSTEDKSDDMEWLSQLFGEKRKKCSSESSEKSSKGENTSGTKKHSSKSMKASAKTLEDTLEPKEGNGFQLHDLVFFGENDFGVIINVEDDRFQILKDDLEGAKVVNIDLHEMKSGSLDKKFTTFGKDMVKLSLNDVVRVSEGPSEGKQGVIKHICQEMVFIYDEHQLENGGYFCANSQSCENIRNCEDSHIENDGEASGFPTSEDFAASPKSPEAPSKKRWERSTFDNNRSGNKDCNFSIGQTLRIRVGPLKGHICRVVAIYRSDVTVKLDSQIKIITVKSEHLSEAGVKSIRNHDSNSMESFDGFAAGLSGATTNDGGWNSAGLTGRRNPWPSFATSDFLVDATAENPSGNDPDKGEDKGDDPWGSKTTAKKVTDNWGQATGTGVDDSGENKLHQVDSWDRATDKGDSGGPASDQWGAAKLPTGEQTAWKDSGGGWDTGKLRIGESADEKCSNWGGQTSNRNEPVDKGKGVVGDEVSGWNQAERSNDGQWGKGGGSDDSGAKGWGTQSGSWDKLKVSDTNNDPWSKGADKSTEQSSWGKAFESSKAAADVSTASAGKNDSQDGWKSNFGAGEIISNNNSWKSAGNSSGWNTKADDKGNQRSGWGGNDNNWNSSAGSKSSSLGGNQSSDWDGKVSNPKSNNQSSGWGSGPVANSADASESSGWKTNAEDKVNSSRPGGNESSGWNGKGSSWNNFSGSKPSSFNGNQSSGGDGNWSTQKSNNQSSGWGGGSVANDKPKWGSDGGNGWNKKDQSSDGDGNWSTQKSNNQSSGWGGGSVSNDKPKWGSDGGNGWNKKDQISDGDGNWSTPKSNNQSSGWGGGSVANDKPKWGSDGGNGWNKKDDSSADQVGGWNAGARDSDGSKSNWNSMKESGGTQSSSWGQKPATKEGTEGGWNKGNTSNTGWGSGQNDKADTAGWGSGSSFGRDQSSGWGRKGNEAGSESQSGGWSKRTFGNKDDNGGNNGGSWQGGGGSSGWNRGSSDNNGDDQVRSSYGDGNSGRGRSFSDRGGFRGRGRRGGGRFGGRGGGQDDSDNNDSFKGQWQQGGDGGSGSWGDGDSGKGGQWQRGGYRGGGRFGGRGRGQDDSDNNDSSKGQWQQGGGNSGGSWGDGGSNRGRWQRGGGRFGGRGREQDSSENNDSTNGQWQQGGGNSFGSWGDENSGKGQWQRGGNRGGGRFGGRGRGRGQDYGENNDSSKGQWQQGSNDDSTRSWGDGGGRGQWQRGGNRGGGRFGGRNRGSDDAGDGGFGKGQWQKDGNSNTGSWSQEGGSSWGQQKQSSKSEGWGSGWNNGKETSNEPSSADHGSNWKQPQTSGASGWTKGTDSSSDTGGGWNKSTNGGNNDKKSEGWGSGWNKGKDTSNDSETSGASGWSSLTKGTDSAGAGGGGWNKDSNAGNNNSKSEAWGSGWNKAKDSSKEPQTWAAKGTDSSAGDAGSGWKKDSNAGNSDGWSKSNAPTAAPSSSGWNAGNNDGWNKPNAPNAAASSSGWSKTTDAKAESADGGQAKDPWEKPPSGSSWVKKGW